MRLLPKRNPELGSMPYIWLLWLLWLPVSALLGAASAWGMAFAILGVIVGAPLSLWGYALRGRRVLWVVGGLVALGLIYAPFNGGAITYFIFAAAFTGQIGAPRVAFRYLAGVLAVIGIEAWAAHLSPYFWAITIPTAGVVGAGLIQVAQRRRLDQKLQQTREEVEQMAKIAERERIARDLHDLLGHTLSLIVLKSELASRLADTDPARAATEIRDVERVSREALEQVRAAVRGYRSTGLDGEVQQAIGVLQTAGIRVETAIDRQNLPAAQEGVVALALREAVTNVVRHSHATTCRLSLRHNGPYCELEVADDGQGGSFPEGSGLSGMRERVESLGGAIDRDSSHGTVLRVRVPV